MRRLVHRAAGVVDVPDAADRVVALDHLVLDPGALEGVGGGEPGGAGADDAYGCGVGGQGPEAIPRQRFGAPNDSYN